MKMKNLLSEMPYPKKYKAKLSEIHAKILDYIIENYDGTKAFQRRTIMYINSITYFVISGDAVPDPVVSDAGLSSITIIDDETCSGLIGDLYIKRDLADWSGIEIVDTKLKEPDPAEDTQAVQKKNIEVFSKNPLPEQSILSDNPTPAAHLYLIAPKIPRFDLTQEPWYQTTLNGQTCAIYKSLPLSPKRQVDITVTTDVNTMSGVELIMLYPNRVVRTRADEMYQPIEGVTLNDDLGLILPIKGFTEAQVLDNIIKYPHLFQLKREVNGEIESFYNCIEIKGELHRVENVIDTLPEFRILPKNAEFIKEYVVRRYLLERDIKHIEHKYPLVGTLDPFLTLFMPSSRYSAYGYENVLDLARTCVRCRVSYLQSRNPFIRSQYAPGTCIFAHRCQQPECDGACPIYGETSYLLERNRVPMSASVFGATDKQLERALYLIRHNENMVVHETTKTIEAANIITYCAICQYWRGNVFRCRVYHLDYSKFIEDTKKSWSLKEIPDDLEYRQIWSSGANVLVISNLDFINFKDFEAQTLLNLVHTRTANGLKTIIVSPTVSSLVGQGAFYRRMQEILREAVIVK